MKKLLFILFTSLFHITLFATPSDAISYISHDLFKEQLESGKVVEVFEYHDRIRGNLLDENGQIYEFEVSWHIGISPFIREAIEKQGLTSKPYKEEKNQIKEHDILELDILQLTMSLAFCILTVSGILTPFLLFRIYRILNK